MVGDQVTEERVRTLGEWPPHFHPVEFKCHDGTLVPPELIGNCIALAWELETLRGVLHGSPVTIKSGYRSPLYNRMIKAATHSRHMTAEAADLVVHGLGARDLHAIIEACIGDGRMRQGGLGLYLPREGRVVGWVHYDIRGTSARWAG